MNSWTASEKIEITSLLTIIINGQKSFGKNASVKETFEYYAMKLEGRFSGYQVTTAMNIYTDQSNDLPSPADLIKLMTPPAPARISTAEFIHAKEQHALEGFPAYGYYGTLIREYEAQNAEERSPKPAAIEDDRVQKIINSSFKRIS